MNKQDKINSFIITNYQAQQSKDIGARLRDLKSIIKSIKRG